MKKKSTKKGVMYIHEVEGKVIYLSTPTPDRNGDIRIKTMVLEVPTIKSGKPDITNYAFTAKDGGKWTTGCYIDMSHIAMGDEVRVEYKCSGRLWVVDDQVQLSKKSQPMVFSDNEAMTITLLSNIKVNTESPDDDRDPGFIPVEDDLPF